MLNEMSRKVVILHEDSTVFNDETMRLVEALNASKISEDVLVVAREQFQTVKTLVIPEDKKTDPQIRNWLNTKFRLEKFNGFLHVIRDCTEILRDPTEFVHNLEAMMSALDYSAWLNTTCDPCNYVFSKYNPRVSVQLDMPSIMASPTLNEIGSAIVTTSHSNLQWVCYDFSKVPNELLSFDEQFTVPMYYIIDFLAKRKASKKDGLYFMNQYLSVSSEYGVFKALPEASSDFSQETMQREDAAFKAKNLNCSPDNNVDVVLENIWKKMSAIIESEKLRSEKPTAV